jgi:hypothetical protein
MTTASVLPDAADPRQNRLLAALPEPECKHLFPCLEQAQLPLGEALYESGDRLNHVYFPANAIVSLLHVMKNGASAEIAVVQSAGHAFRLGGNLLKQEFNRAGALQHRRLCSTLAMLTPMAQTAVCNRHHTVNQQLCRWLLLSLDRLPSNDLSMTQELIANMLGLRRGA